MKKTLLLLISSILLIPSLNFSQNQWTQVSHFNNNIWDIKEFDGKLFIVGVFTENEGQTSNYSAYYDNGNVVRDTNDYGNGGIMSLEVFNNQLWAGTGITINNSFSGASYWNNNSWQLGGYSNYSATGLFADNNELHGGFFGHGLAKTTNIVSWSTIAPVDGNLDDIRKIIKYNDTIVVGGVISTSNGNTINNLGYYDGTELQTFGNGTDGDVNTMEVYNGELYIGGAFANADGTSANFIAKWDGNNWSDVGGSVTGSGVDGIYDMLVYNNKLYVVGDFDEIGGVAVNGAAYWDGSNWNGINFPSIQSYPRCIEVMDYYLYASTSKDSFNSDTSHLYRMPLSLASSEYKNSESNMLIYPNPTNGDISLNTNSNIEYISIHDNAGREVMRMNQVNKSVVNLSLEEVESGVYFVICKTEEGINIEKLIKK